eukprot:1339802-Amorphochlora_amoeboformis.AAC.1
MSTAIARLLQLHELNRKLTVFLGVRFLSQLLEATLPAGTAGYLLVPGTIGCEDLRRVSRISVDPYRVQVYE